jgi:hypothetical protein
LLLGPVGVLSVVGEVALVAGESRGRRGVGFAVVAVLLVGRRRGAAESVILIVHLVMIFFMICISISSS